MLTLGLGRSSMRVMPSLGSGRYSPGPGTELLLEEGVYQEIRPPVANCSRTWPDFLAIDSIVSSRMRVHFPTMEIRVQGMHQGDRDRPDARRCLLHEEPRLQGDQENRQGDG